MSSRNFNRVFATGLLVFAVIFAGAILVGCDDNEMNSSNTAMTNSSTSEAKACSNKQGCNIQKASVSRDMKVCPKGCKCGACMTKMSNDAKACPNKQGCMMNKANISDNTKACPKGCKCGACMAKMSNDAKACPNKQGCMMNKASMSDNTKACPEGCKCNACITKKAAAAVSDQASKESTDK